MTEPTERQVLYALVAAALFVVVAALAIAAAVAGVSPPGWSLGFGVGWLAAAVAGFATWRRTGRLLMLALVVFAVWAAGTLLTR
ncbi:MAG: hypothetical protein WD020_00500 [Acidimicrobiia bacterium]